MPRMVPSQVVEFIDQQLPFATTKSGSDPVLIEGTQAGGRLGALADLVDQITPAAIILEGSEYALLVLAVSLLRRTEQRWLTHPTDHMPQIGRGKDQRTPVSVPRDCLAKCPDEFPTPTTSELDFIADAEFRDALRNDIGGVERAIANGEWKSATVLAGSVLEALLLWAIRQSGHKGYSGAGTPHGSSASKAAGDPNEWSLGKYIDVAENLHLISKESATQARLAKDFRNLIHPGRQERLRQKCDRATALSAVAAVEHVVRDLQERWTVGVPGARYLLRECP